MQVQRAKFAGADVSGTDWSRVDAGEALLKGVKGLMSVTGYDVAGTEMSRGAPPPMGMDAFSFELYMQRRNLPPLQVRISHAFAHARRLSNTFNNPLRCPLPPPLQDTISHSRMEQVRVHQHSPSIAASNSNIDCERHVSHRSARA